MKKTFPILILTLIFGCKEKKTDFTKLDWKPVDSSLSFYVTNQGNAISKSKEISTQLLGYILKDSGIYVALPVTDPVITMFPQELDNKWLYLEMGHLVKSNDEGFLRLNFNNEINSVRPVRVFITDAVSPSEIDLIQTWLKNNSDVETVKYISKEEAAKIYLQNEKEDVTEVTGINPLPNAFEVYLKQPSQENYSAELKDKLEQEFGNKIDVKLPNTNYGILKNKQFIFHFKAL